MKLSDYVIDFTARQGVNHVFEFIGGAITHLIDSIHHREDMECISVHHEQTGAFAAEAYARINGRLGLAMATSGPGALNMVTGIGSCWFDSVPCLFITGQVNTYEYKFDRPVRQIGFQETDIVSVVKPLTKYAVLVTEAESIRYHLEKAVWLAQNGRPGPVLLDIPMNIQRAQIDPDTLAGFLGSAEHAALATVPGIDPDAVRQVAAMIATAQRPVILAGGGVRTAQGTDELQSLVELTGIPVVATLMGLDAVPHDNPAFFGMIGSYGNRFSNMTLANSDLLLILGARLDSRQTGTRPDTFARAATRVHVDIDPNELNAKVQVDLALQGDVREFLAALNRELAGSAKPDLKSWYAVINGYRAKYPTYADPEEFPGIDPNRFMEILSDRCREGDLISLDVGQNQMWAGQSFRLKKDQRMLISGGMGAMGFALPAALGAAKAVAGRRSLAIAGDGGIQVNIQDLEVIVSRRLPVKVIVLNNNCLGMVRQFQDMYFGGRRQSTVIGYGCPNLVKIAEAYGLPAFTIDSLETAASVLDQALALDGPAYVEVAITQNSCVNPKLVVNRPIEDMSPHLDRKELEDAMLIDLVDEGEVPE
ncbi:thiamine pyrophosphate-binding protein [Geobacter pelophilus]|uniref:Thiamine pyrophosphate-binding protein n=1 Tax=Geoanaerobacter pelophilus TaxID=60036 RepID=A0AAW4L815_9BACT|nr:thiamine pyrophosphate-binding protein [Geoanaerobacter pelophilus]MBT0666302.1 thiamine pyrophosphate-binding protein [Geoanaerobacter pelophilus]